MLLIKTFLGKSSIDGLGLFVAEPVKKGVATWKFVEGFDLAIDKDQLEKLSKETKEYLEKYCYLSKKSGLYILCSDDSKYMNHSTNPTTKGLYSLEEHSEGLDIATRDLEVGEELTCDYRTFEARNLDWLK